jgi:hypothetical protein
VILKWKVQLAGLLCLIALLATGCGGINASHSISPASFFLPGLMKNEPQPQAPDITLPAAVSSTNQLARL